MATNEFQGLFADVEIDRLYFFLLWRSETKWNVAY